MRNLIRRAILIGAPGAGKEHLQGVKWDLAKMRNYLRSPCSGGWLPREIISLTNPSAEQLFQELSAVGGADYLLVYFSGHGFELKSGQEFEVGARRGQGLDSGFSRMLWINNEEYIEDLSLLIGCARQLVVCDGCRVRSGAAMGGIPAHPGEFVAQDDFWSTRAVFDSYIQVSPIGQVIVHATEPGGFAYEDENGGKFTSALLNMATNWRAGDQWSPFFVDELTFAAGDVLFSSGYDQRPQILQVSGNLQVPFGIESWVGGEVSGLAMQPVKQPGKGWMVAGGLLAAIWLAGGFDR